MKEIDFRRGSHTNKTDALIHPIHTHTHHLKTNVTMMSFKNKMNGNDTTTTTAANSDSDSDSNGDEHFVIQNQRDSNDDEKEEEETTTSWFDKLCDQMKVEDGNNDGDRGGEEDSMSALGEDAAAILEEVAEEIVEELVVRTGRDVAISNNDTSYYQNQNQNQLMLADFHGDDHSSSNHDQRLHSISWTSALLTSPIRNMEEEEDDEGIGPTASTESTGTRTGTTKGRKSLDRLLQFAPSSSTSFIRSASAQSRPMTGLLSSTTTLPSTSTASARKRPGGKAMRLISSQKRFQAQHRRHRQSLSFRPLLELPSEVLSSIMCFMDVQTLLNMRFVCKKSKTIASRDDAGWSSHCDRLWKNKVHVSKHARQLHRKQNGQCMKAYKESIRDAHERQHIDDDELCYDPVSQTGTVWSFRFKKTAGEIWTDKDPWYSGGDARQMVFLKDGTIRQLATTTTIKDGSKDSSASTPAKATRKLTAPFSDVQQRQQQQHHRQQRQQQDRENQQQHQQPVLGGGGGTSTASGIVMTWRYIDQPLDKPSGPKGSYIRINVSGRDVPTYFCQRAPEEFGNWGFVMDSLWGMFASFVIPRRRTVLRLRRTVTGARWIHVENEEMDSDSSDAEDDDGNNTNASSNHLGRLLSDANLPTTIQRQWKEALIYNTGSLRILPHGEEGVREFDRIFIG